MGQCGSRARLACVADELIVRRESRRWPASKRAAYSVILGVSSEEVALMSPFAGEAAFHEFVTARTPSLMRTAYLLAAGNQPSGALHTDHPPLPLGEGSAILRIVTHRRLRSLMSPCCAWSHAAPSSSDV